MKRAGFFLIVMALSFSGAVFAERAAPKRLASNQLLPVIQEGIEYTAPNAFGGCGQVVAKDVKAGKELWRKQIYSIKRDPNLEGDIQDVWISKLEKRGAKLFVQNEWGGEFELNLATREVVKIKGDEIIDFSNPATMRAGRKK
jgi:hypothetical protein